MSLLKKLLPRALLLLSGLIVGIIAATALFVFTGFSFFDRFSKEAPPSGDMSNTELTTLAFSVLEYIKSGDYYALSNIAHPEFGVVFSPHATVTPSTNRCFRADQIAAFGDDTNVYVWGILSGSGEPIEMTPVDYFYKFVFDKDYTAAPVVGINHIVRSGNALENITEVFPNVKFVDFHIAGGDMDPTDDFAWSSLRLGFEEYDGRLRLTVVIHSMWTV